MAEVRNRVCDRCPTTFLTSEDATTCPKCERDDLRAKLAVCEKELAEARSPKRCPFGETRECAREACEERLRMKLDRNVALSEAERLRGALEKVRSLCDGEMFDTEQYVAACENAAAIAGNALSPATPAAPTKCAECERLRERVVVLADRLRALLDASRAWTSWQIARSIPSGGRPVPQGSNDVEPPQDRLERCENEAEAALAPTCKSGLQVAPSSEYRRGYERAVEDAVKAAKEVSCPGPHGEGYCVALPSMMDALHALRPAPEREESAT